jgi:hypothetical protein
MTANFAHAPVARAARSDRVHRGDGGSIYTPINLEQLLSDGSAAACRQLDRSACE